MSNNENENNDFILVIKEINKEFSMKTNYILLIILSIIEVLSEFFLLVNVFYKTIIGKIIFILIFFQSNIYLSFSIYYLFKIKICAKNRKEIMASFNENNLKSYRKITKILIILGLFVTIIYFVYILLFFFICFNDKILPNCDDWNKNKFRNIIDLKYCQDYKCLDISKYNTQTNNLKNYNYLCNFRLTEYLNTENNINCFLLEKEKINDIYISSKSLNIFFKGKNSITSRIIYYFLISCDFDFKKYLYFCNSENELNKNNYNEALNFSIISKFNEYINTINEIEETKTEINYKNAECVTLFTFLIFMLLNIIIFFTFPIKIDIWYNENTRYEIIKKKIHSFRLRVNNNLENNNNDDNIYYDDNSTSTENSSDKSSELSVNDNNDFEVQIQN